MEAQSFKQLQFVVTKWCCCGSSCIHPACKPFSSNLRTCLVLRGTVSSCELSFPPLGGCSLPSLPVRDAGWDQVYAQ